MNALLKSLLKKLGYVVAGFVIFIAVMVCISRLLTPVLDHHKADFENLASQFLQAPITIHNVRVSWYRYQPVISLNEVKILDHESKIPIFKVKKLSLMISIFRSLREWKFLTDGIMVSGADVNVSESATGEWTVKEFSTLPFAKPAETEASLKDILGWLSQEPYLILSDINVYYTGVGKVDRFVTLYNLGFENSDQEHKIAGKAILHQEIPTTVTLAADWNGKATDIPNINAHAYLYVSGVSLSQWTKGMSLKNWQVKKGIVSAKLWADWSQGNFQKIQSTFQSYGLDLFSESSKITHHINRVSGNIGWRREGNLQTIAGDEILVDLPNHLWPVTNFSFTWSQDANGVISPGALNIGYADLADVQPFLFSMPEILSDENKQLLNKMQLSGILQNTSINFPASVPLQAENWKQLPFNTHFSQLSFLPVDKIPGIENLQGSISWNGKQGEIALNSKDAVFQQDSIFPNKLELDQLSGQIQVQRINNSDLIFNITSSNLLNRDLAANFTGSIKLSASGSPVTDLKANLTMNEAKNITRYLPAGIFDKSLNTWLNQAFLSGEIVSTHAILRGTLADFPFDKKNGEFTIESKISNMDFRFAPTWPILHDITAVLTFTGRKIIVDVDHTETMNIPIGKVHAVIPYLGDAKPEVVEVTTSEINTDFVQGMKYVHASPLEKNIGKMFSDVELQGPITLKLGLVVPFSNPDNTKVQGELGMKDGVMNLIPWNLKLDQLNGQLVFTENSTNAKNIQARLFDKPLQFDLTTVVDKSKNTSIIQASFNNHFDFKDFETWLKLPLSKVIQGSSTINAKIDLSLTNPLQVHLRSNLAGASINLPQPYDKKMNEARDTSADIVLQPSQPMKIKLSYGKLLSTAILLDRKQNNYHLIGANLQFGPGNIIDWPAGPGIYISGQFDTLDWNKVKSLASQNDNKNNFSDLSLKNINIKANRVLIGGQTISDVNLQVIPDDTIWDVHVNSPDISGQISVPIKITRQSRVIAQFEKINVNMDPDAKSTLQIDVRSLPAISLIANSVQYNGITLGKIVFNAVPSDGGLNIQGLHIISPNIDLRASGEWKEGGKTDSTYLQGSASSTQVSRLLNSFGMDVKNFIAMRGNMNFSLSWQDSPFAPSISSMNGRASLAIGEGRIVDIGANNGATMDLGKMLSIFSLQTIPRRLSLDFSDIFQKGYSFDSLRGDFTIQDGELHTSNMRFDGPVAKISINGKIGLKNKTYNFILGVAANVTSSIPVAATLLTGNPLIGLGALAVNTVIGSKVATRYYAVSGPWSNPQWRPVSGASR